MWCAAVGRAAFGSDGRGGWVDSSALVASYTMRILAHPGDREAELSMAVKLRIYLDTSVISACVDPRDPVRQELTREFWRRRPVYEAYICPLVLEEIAATRDMARREEMHRLAEPLIVLPWQPEMEGLAERYLWSGAFTPALRQDARHVAACTVTGIPVLLIRFTINSCALLGAC